MCIHTYACISTYIYKIHDSFLLAFNDSFFRLEAIHPVFMLPLYSYGY